MNLDRTSFQVLFCRPLSLSVNMNNNYFVVFAYSTIRQEMRYKYINVHSKSHWLASLIYRMKPKTKNNEKNQKQNAVAMPTKICGQFLSFAYAPE